MGNLIFILFLISFLTLIGFGLLLIIRLIFKKGMAPKRILIIMGSSFAIVLISLIMLPPSENGDAEANRSEPLEEPDESIETSVVNKESSEQETKEDAEKQEDNKNENEAEKIAEQDDVEIHLNVFEAANKELSEVNKLLGEGEKIDEGEFNSYLPSETYVYDDQSIEIYFIDGVAARITLTPKEDISFNDEETRETYLRQYGFPFWSSSEETERAIRWESVGSISDGLYEVTMFNDGEGNINYVYVITEEKYK